MIVKTMKYRIEYDEKLYEYLREIQYNVFRIKNKTVSMAYDFQQFSFGYKERFGKYPNQKEVIGQSLKQDIYHTVKEWNEGYNSTFCDASIKEALEKFDEQKLRVLKGEESLVSYRRDGSFPIRSGQIRQLKKSKKNLFEVKLSLLSPSKAKKEGVPSQVVVKLRSGGGATSIMERIIEGSYSLGDSRVTYCKRKKRYFLLLAYRFKKKEVFADENIVMGVHLGVVNPITISIKDAPYPTEYVGTAQEVRNFEQQMRRRRKSIQVSRKWAGKGSSGRGVKTRIKPLTKIKAKISNFKKLKNHQWSRYIVDQAIKNGVGLIQIEDLTGISDSYFEHKFLRNWTYYDLQEKITYKANEVGIKVLRVNPSYTSSRCYDCGAIFHKDVADKRWRKPLQRFTCLNCGTKKCADKNASMNLTIKDIDKIIETEKDDWFEKWSSEVN